MEINTDLKVGDKIQWTPRTMDMWFNYYIVGFIPAAASLSFVCVDRCNMQCSYFNQWVAISENKDTPINKCKHTFACNIRKIEV